MTQYTQVEIQKIDSLNQETIRGFSSGKLSALAAGSRSAALSAVVTRRLNECYFV